MNHKKSRKETNWLEVQVSIVTVHQRRTGSGWSEWAQRRGGRVSQQRCRHLRQLCKQRNTVSSIIKYFQFTLLSVLKATVAQNHDRPKSGLAFSKRSVWWTTGWKEYSGGGTTSSEAAWSHFVWNEHMRERNRASSSISVQIRRFLTALSVWGRTGLGFFHLEISRTRLLLYQHTV